MTGNILETNTRNKLTSLNSEKEENIKSIRHYFNKVVENQEKNDSSSSFDYHISELRNIVGSYLRS